MNQLTAKAQRTQKFFIVFVREFLCGLCVSAVKTVLMYGHKSGQGMNDA
jgi:hypothetical protein